MNFVLRLSSFVLLLLLAGCQALKVERPTVVSPSDWLTEGSSPQRQNAVAMVLDPPLEKVWEYNANAGFGPMSPLILGDAVIVANRKGEVHGVRLSTGKKLGLSEFGDAIEGTPVVGDGVLYVPVGWGGRALQAYDLEASRTRWKLKTAPVEAGLLLAGDLLVAADQEGFVRAYDTREGEVVWEHELVDDVGVEATPVALAGGLLAVADDTGRLVALDAADGTVAWTRRLDAPVYATPAADDATVYVSTTRGLLVALDAADGEVRWVYDVPDTTVYFTSPAVAGDELVVGGSDGVLRALDARTGEERWTRVLDGAIAAPPLLTQRTLYVGTMSNDLYAVDRATGEVRWSEELDGRIKSPMAFKDGHLVVLSEPRTVYLFKHAGNDYASSK